MSDEEFRSRETARQAGFNGQIDTSGHYSYYVAGQMERQRQETNAYRPPAPDNNVYSSLPESPEAREERIALAKSIAFVGIGILGVLALLQGCAVTLRSALDMIPRGPSLQEKADKRFVPELTKIASRPTDDDIVAINNFTSHSSCHRERATLVFNGQTEGFIRPCNFNEPIGNLFDGTIILAQTQYNRTESKNLSYTIEYRAKAYPLTSQNLDTSASHVSNYDADDIKGALAKFGEAKIRRLMTTNPGQCAIVYNYRLASAMATIGNDSTKVYANTESYRLACLDKNRRLKPV